MDVTNSTFTDGLKFHINGIDARVKLDKVHIYDSESKAESGHGVMCERCKFIGINKSKFERLRSGEYGGAVYISEQLDIGQTQISYITDSEFIDNSS